MLKAILYSMCQAPPIVGGNDFLHLENNAPYRTMGHDSVRQGQSLSPFQGCFLRTNSFGFPIQRWSGGRL